MPSSSATAAAGPHGMHPIGQGWVSFHHDDIHSDTDHLKCAVCHGADFRGTVLSRTLGPRTLTASLNGGNVTLNLFQGAMVGCYNCHNGPRSESLNTSVAPVANSITTNTTSGKAVAFTLPVTGVGAAARVISQPAHGSVGLSNAVATYFPDPGFVGTDRFTFAAWDGGKNSALATGTVVVAEGPYSIAVHALVPPDYPAGWPAAFTAVAAPSNTMASVSYSWNFGDGSPLNTNRYATHVYSVPGTYPWSLLVRAGTATASASGSIVVGAPIQLGILGQPVGATILWPRSAADAVLERTAGLEPPRFWAAETNSVLTNPLSLEVDVPTADASAFFRLRQVQ